MQDKRMPDKQRLHPSLPILHRPAIPSPSPAHRSVDAIPDSPVPLCQYLRHPPCLAATMALSFHCIMCVCLPHPQEGILVIQQLLLTCLITCLLLLHPKQSCYPFLLFPTHQPPYSSSSLLTSSLMQRCEHFASSFLQLFPLSPRFRLCSRQSTPIDHNLSPELLTERREGKKTFSPSPHSIVFLHHGSY